MMYADQMHNARLACTLRCTYDHGVLRTEETSSIIGLPTEYLLGEIHHSITVS